MSTVIVTSSGQGSYALTISSGVELDVLSGGFANTITVLGGGVMSAAPGASLQEIQVSSGGQLFASGVAYEIYGLDTWSIGGLVAGISATGSNTALDVLSGGELANVHVYTDYINGPSVDRNTVYIESGASALSVTVTNRVTMDVYAGGVERGTTLNAGSMEYLYAVGGGETISSGAALDVVGGQASGVTVQAGGALYVAQHGRVSSVSLASRAEISLDTNETVTGLTVAAGAMIAPGLGSSVVYSAMLVGGNTLQVISGGVVLESIGLAGDVSALDFVVQSGVIQVIAVPTERDIVVSSGVTRSGLSRGLTEDADRPVGGHGRRRHHPERRDPHRVLRRDGQRGHDQQRRQRGVPGRRPG
jgi:hypothetical protein